MRIFPPPLEIGETEGFTSEKDIFQRADLGKSLTNLVSSVSDPMVIAVDGQWGSGKTVFLRMWAGELRNAGVPVVWFDAFENDYAPDAFSALVGEVYALVEEANKAKSQAAKKLKSVAIKTGKVILRSALTIGVRAATAGVLNAADLEKASGDIAAELSGAFDKYVGELITKQRENKATIASFRETLALLPELLSISQGIEDADDSSNTKPLIFIVDELDRCRPSFALEVLERMKHLFSVENVHFVFGCHLDQLRNSVRAIYGPDIDAQAYLQKFIQVSFVLDGTAPRPTRRATRRYLDHLSTTMDIGQQSGHAFAQAMDVIRRVADQRDLSLRTLERILSVLTLTLTLRKSNVLTPGVIIGGLCVLKVVAPDTYRDAKQGNLSYENAKALLYLEADDRELNRGDWNQDFPVKWWRYCTDPEAEGEQWFGDFNNELSFRYGFDNRYQIVPYVASELIDRFLILEG